MDHLKLKWLKRQIPMNDRHIGILCVVEERTPQQVVSEGGDCPFDCKTLLDSGVLTAPQRQLAADVQHGAPLDVVNVTADHYLK